MKPGLINKIALNPSFDEELNKTIVKAGAMVANANNEAICKAIQYAKENKVTEFNIIDKAILNQTLEVAVKYRKIKDIEEQLGCPLDVLFKALKQGYIFTKFGKRYIENINYGCYGEKLLIRFSTETIDYHCEDYKKTWWLKENKSE